MNPDTRNPTPETPKPDRPVLINVVVLVVVAVSMVAFPIRKTWKTRNDPHPLASVRGRVMAQAFDKIAITNRESAAAILRCVDPTLELATLPGLPRGDQGPVLAWSVVDLPPDPPRESLLLISRNVRADSIASLTGRVADALSNEPPFGTNSAMVVYRSGRTTTIQGSSLEGTWLGFLCESPTNCRILRPE